MKLKSTPGPWYACCKDGDAHFVFGPSGDTTICHMSHNDPELDHYERLAGIVTIQERRANARLIAESPAMIEALIETRALLISILRGALGDEADECIATLAYNDIVIERATGMSIDEVLKGE